MHLLDFLALKHLATLRKQEEISTAWKNEIGKAVISIVYKEEGNANDKGIKPFHCFLWGIGGGEGIMYEIGFRNVSIRYVTLCWRSELAFFGFSFHPFI
jgi:hypothetical protein